MFENPKKAKIVFWIVLSLAVLFLAGSVAFGYLYVKATDLDVWKESIVVLKNEKIEQLESQISDLKGEKEAISAEGEKTKEELEAENVAYEAQISSYKAKVANANAYNNVLIHMNSVIETHGGFSGWTDAEYQTGLGLAQATGNANFVATINWAWYETSIDPVTRVIRVLKEIAAGIGSALK